MTKAEWDQLKIDLSHAYGSAELLVDGFKLSLRVEKVKGLKYEITPYVNGKFEGRWCLDKTEEAVRFMRPVTRHLYRPSLKKKLTKGLSKSAVKRMFPDIDKTSVYYTWGWQAFSSFKSHLIKNNKSIERVKAEETLA